MLSYSNQILSIFVSYLVLVLSSYFTNRVNSFIHTHFNFFELCQLLIINFKSIHCAQTQLLLMSFKWDVSHRTLRARSFCLRRSSSIKYLPLKIIILYLVIETNILMIIIFRTLIEQILSVFQFNFDFASIFMIS